MSVADDVIKTAEIPEGPSMTLGVLSSRYHKLVHILQVHTNSHFSAKEDSIERLRSYAVWDTVLARLGFLILQ
jgi:hypothetical protein